MKWIRFIRRIHGGQSRCNYLWSKNRKLSNNAFKTICHPGPIVLQGEPGKINSQLVAAEIKIDSNPYVICAYLFIVVLGICHID